MGTGHGRVPARRRQGFEHAIHVLFFAVTMEWKVQECRAGIGSEISAFQYLPNLLIV
jgi:hypothetical protein